MRIGIITIHAARNYGSALQTFATQELFSQLGHSAKIVDYRRETHRNETIIQAKLTLNKKWNKTPLTQYIYRILKSHSFRKLSGSIETFIKERINLTSREYLSLSALSCCNEDFDIFCSGSDQIWSNKVWGDFIDEYFLQFALPGKRCISFSSSFGDTNFREQERSKLKRLLSIYSYLSIRESSGLSLLRELGFPNAILTLDPTLCHTSDFWGGIADPQSIHERYLLVYQLNPNHEFDRQAKETAKAMRCKLIRICLDDSHMLLNGTKVFYPSVQRFLSLIRDATYIMTDSFHGTAFSLIFNKQFSVFLPPKSSERLHSILNLTMQSNRIHTGSSDPSTIFREINYSTVNRILDEGRCFSIEYLRNATKR